MTISINRRSVSLVLLAVLLAGVAAECEQAPNGRGAGTYQGGGDSAPRHRR